MYRECICACTTPTAEVEALLVSLILDGQVWDRILFTKELVCACNMTRATRLIHMVGCLIWQVDGRIDQVGQLLLLNASAADATKCARMQRCNACLHVHTHVRVNTCIRVHGLVHGRYAAVDKWASQLAQLQQAVFAKLN